VTSVPSVLDVPADQQRGASALAGIGAAGAHALIAAIALAGAGLAREVVPALSVTEMVEVELPRAVAEPEKPSEPPPSARERVRSAPTEPTPAQQPPAAAQADQLLVASEEVMDFGDTFVERTGKGFAGGATDSGGTSTRAVRSLTARTTPAVTPIVSVPAPDRSRPPRLAGGMNWDCDFPPEADDPGMDHAVVTLRVEVSARGEVRAAHATSDPGFGFARVARRCAMSKRWSAGFDRDGRPANSVALVHVRFAR
jgi:hypothetical protein